MLMMAGNVRAIPTMNNLFLFNFTSLCENVERWNIVSDWLNGAYLGDELQFCDAFIHYIIEDDNAFFAFFSMLYQYYLGNNIYIMIDDTSPFLSLMNEFLFDFIHDRYGINVFVLNDPDDYLSIDESLCDMTIFGVGIFDQDKERYTTMAVAKDIQLKGFEQVKKEYGIIE